MCTRIVVTALILNDVKKTDKSRTIHFNQELTVMYEEVFINLESSHTAFLRMNYSILAEGTFGILKYGRFYK